MADDDKDLVSEVKIVGIEDSTDELNKYGDAGASAFDKIASAASKASGVVSKATKEFADGYKNAADGMDKLPPKVQAITNAAGASVGALREGAAAAGKFALVIGSIAASAVAGVAGVAKFASAITEQVRGVNKAIDATNDLTQQQKKNNQQAAQSVSTAAQYQSQLNALNRSVVQGKTSYEDYTTQLDDLNFSFRESAKVQAQVQAAQDDALKKNQELERQAADRNALAALNKQYGTTLTQSLIRLGGQYDIVADKVRDAFGPVVGKLLDNLSSLLEKNAGSIETFIDKAASSLSSFLERNGPQIQKFMQGVFQAAQAVAEIIVSVVIPAFNGLLSFMDKVAAVLNSIFGSNVTGAFLLVVAAVAALTGTFTSLGAILVTVATAVAGLIAAFGLVPILITALVVAFVAFLASVDWTAFAQRAVKAGQDIINFFSTMPAAIGALFTTLWTFISDGFTLLVQTVLAAWQAIVDFFSGLVATVQGIFAQISQVIQDAFRSALDFVIGLFTTWATAVMKFINPILNALNKVKTLMSAAQGGAGNSSVSAAGGGHIRGPGTGTSDSIPAWLSNNEFVIKAKSVAKYGVGFLRALNSGKLKLPGFAMGGLVSGLAGMPSPMRFASGGEVRQNGTSAGSKMFDLHIDGTTFRGLLAPVDVADKMTQFAISRGSLSAGRKPGWVGGNN